MMGIKDYKELEKLAKEVSNWLKENGHPHMKVIIDQAGILLTEDIYGNPNGFLDNDLKKCDTNE